MIHALLSLFFTTIGLLVVTWLHVKSRQSQRKWPWRVLQITSIVLVVGFVFSGRSDTPTPPPTKDVEVEAQAKDTAPPSEIKKLFFTLDWGVTTPGKKLGEFVDQGLVNWIMWPLTVWILVVVAEKMVAKVRGIKNQAPPSKPAETSNTGFRVVLLIGMAALGYWYFFSTSESTGPENPETVYVGIDMRGKGENATANVTIPVDGGFRIALPATRRGETLQVCIKTPEGMPSPSFRWTRGDVHGVVHHATLSARATTWLVERDFKELNLLITLRKAGECQ